MSFIYASSFGIAEQIEVQSHRISTKWRGKPFPLLLPPTVVCRVVVIVLGRSAPSAPNTRNTPELFCEGLLICASKSQPFRPPLLSAHCHWVNRRAPFPAADDKRHIGSHNGSHNERCLHHGGYSSRNSDIECRYCRSRMAYGRTPDTCCVRGNRLNNHGRSSLLSNRLAADCEARLLLLRP